MPTKSEIEQGFISLQDAAQLLGVSPDTIRLRHAGTEPLTHLRMGSKIVLLRAELNEFIAAKIAHARTQSPANKIRQHQRRLRLVG
jgi:Helix-turn-helix domain